MNRSIQRLVSVVTAVFMLVTCVFAQGTVVWAGSSDGSSEVKGMYSYTSNEGSNIQEKDIFVYKDEYFQRSSFVQDDGLLTLSTQAAIASASRYGDEVDLYERDAAKSGENIQDMLTEMGFQDVAVNKYNGIQPLKNSGACTIGHRTIDAFGQKYTLLAVIPRSAGYKEEWAGNFTVGDGDVATGFKAARDEALRFLKQYIQKNHIKGNLKVWITGHSRGSAVTNLLGGFLAGGGAEYLGANVSLTPQDVYCYGFANPGTVRNGASKEEAFSVAGSRGGEYAAYDTPGESWRWTKGGKIDVNDQVYTGVRNYPFSFDFITDLPPKDWGYTRFGKDYSISGDGAVADEDMIKELKKVSMFAYKRYVNGGDYRDFEAMSFDLWNLEAKGTGKKTGAKGMTDFVTSMVTGMSSLIETGTYESSGYQEALSALAGVYGMSVLQFDEEYKSGMGDLVEPGALAYLAYASEKLQKEGKASDDTEAAVIVLKDLLEYASGEKIDLDSFTVDDCIALIAKAINKNEKSKLVQELKDIVVENIPAGYEKTIKNGLGTFHPDYNKEGWDNVPISDVVMAFINACVEGAKPDTYAYSLGEYYKDPANVRSLLYMVFIAIPEASKIIGDGTKSFSQAVSDAMPLLLKGKDDEGQEITYDNFADAADAGFVSVLNSSENAISKKIIKKIQDENMYDEAFVSDLQGDFNTLCEKKNISKVRAFILNLFLNTGKAYDTKANIQRIATFVGNVDRIPPAHYNEVFVAWAKAREKAGIGENNSIQHVPAKDPTCVTKGNVECWGATIAGSVRYFADPELKREVSADSLVLDVVDHTPGDAVAENEQYAEDGRVERYDSVVYCEVCEEELSRETIVKLTDLSEADVKVSDASYTGNELQPEPVVTLNGAVLESGMDYAVTYENNKKVGIASLTIKGIGKYMGTANASFRILPKTTKITSLKAAKVTKKKVTKKGFTVRWKKQKAQTTGYQIQYSTKKDFKSADTVTVKKNTITQKTVTGLKAKTYYVRVRTYKSVNDKNYYSAWSVKKKVGVK